MAFPSVYEMTNSLTPVTQSSTKTYDQQADGDFVDIWNTNPYIAIKVIAGSTAIDTWIQKINMKLYKNGTPAGSAYIRVWDANNNVVESVEFIPNTHLTTTSTVYSFSLPKPIQLKVNYKVGLQYNGSTSSSNRINARYTPSGTTQSGFSVSTSSNLDAGLTNRNVYMTFDANATGTALMTNRRRQHFWEYFSGSTLNSRWTQTEVNPPASFAMTDLADGGFRITADGGALNEGMINFNNKRTFSKTGSVCIWVGRDVQTTSYTGYYGLANGITGSDADMGQLATIYNTNGNGVIAFRTGNTTKSNTESTIALDTNFHTYKIEMKSASSEWSVDGVAQAARTTGDGKPLPTLDLQPVAGVHGNSKSIDVKYCEAYNT